MPKLNWKKIGIGSGISFFAFQLISLVLKSIFPETSVFSRIVRGYSLVWIWILFALIIGFVGYFIFKFRSLDKISVFTGLLALSILSVIVIYFGIDLGQLFDMSIARSQLGSIVGSVTPTVGSNIVSGSILGDSFMNVWLGLGTFGQAAILLVMFFVFVGIALTKKGQ